MINKYYYISYLFLLSTIMSFTLTAQENETLAKALDFTVLQNENIAVLYDGAYDEVAKGFVGVFQALDYKGRLQYNKQYYFKMPDSLLLESQDQIKITEAHALTLTKNNSLFYGKISAKRPMTFVLLIDKKGRIKKQLFREIDLTEIYKKTEVESFRTGMYLWLVSNQLNLHIAPYFSPHSKNFAQVYLRKITSKQEEIMFDSFSLNEKDSTTIIRYKDDLKIKWEHELKGVFGKNIQTFKLTETAQAFYFVLYLVSDNQLVPTVYVVDKNTGKINLQTIQKSNRA